MAIARRLHALLFLLGSLNMAATGLLSRLSLESDGSRAFTSSSVLLMAEFCKFVISCVLLAWRERSVRVAVALLHRVLTLRAWLAFGAPSVIYSISNNVEIRCAMYMDAATFQIASQTKVLFISVLWWCVFRIPIEASRLCGLLLLMLGGLCAAWPTKEAGGTMFITPGGVPLVASLVCLSAWASVTGEYVYKRVMTEEGIHLQNVAMYSWGVILNLLAFIMSADLSPQDNLEDIIDLGDSLPYLVLFRGWNVWTCCMVVNYTTMGFVIGIVMKYLSAVHKLVMGGASMYVSFAATFGLFGLQPSPMYLCGLLLVTFALLTYHWNEFVACADTCCRPGTLVKMHALDV